MEIWWLIWRLLTAVEIFLLFLENCLLNWRKTEQKPITAQSRQVNQSKSANETIVRCKICIDLIMWPILVQLSTCVYEHLPLADCMNKLPPPLAFIYTRTRVWIMFLAMVAQCCSCTLLHSPRGFLRCWGSASSHIPTEPRYVRKMHDRANVSGVTLTIATQTAYPNCRQSPFCMCNCRQSRDGFVSVVLFGRLSRFQSKNRFSEYKREMM